MGGEFRCGMYWKVNSDVWEKNNKDDGFGLVAE